MSKIKITSDGVVTNLEVDGVDMSKASAVLFQHIAGEVPTVTLTLPVDEVSIDCVAKMRPQKQ